MKSLVIIFGVFIVGLLFIVAWNYNSNSQIDHNNYNEISWRLPLDKEIKKIKDSFHNSNILGCRTYFIKKFEGEKYLIACDTGDGTWAYYTAYTGQHKIYRTPREFTATLLPPSIPNEDPESDILDPKPKPPAKSLYSRESLEAR